MHKSVGGAIKQYKADVKQLLGLLTEIPKHGYCPVVFVLDMTEI